MGKKSWELDLEEKIVCVCVCAHAHVHVCVYNQNNVWMVGEDVLVLS